MGMNLAGAEVALKLVERIEELEIEVKQLSEQVHLFQKHTQTGSG